MANDEKLLEAIRRRAYGFYYDEENLEYENKDPKKYLLCKTGRRLYFGCGFLKVKVKKMFSASARVQFNVVKIISPSNCKLKKLGCCTLKNSA